MQQPLTILLDLVAITVLVFGIYVPRHKRRDLIPAFLGVNVGVLGVAMMLATNDVGVGLGLGLFGVLSIIRLRSQEIAQHEVAYYFASLALGLLAGLATPGMLSISLMALIVVVMFIGDHPRILRAYSEQAVVLDRAISDPEALKRELAQLLNATVHSVSVERLDLVNDSTTVRVRYRQEHTSRALDTPQHESLSAV